MPRVLVVGLGNEFRGDDAAGLLVARRLAGSAGVDVAENSGDAAELLDKWEGADLVIVVDAAATGGEPGSVRRLDPVAEAGALRRVALSSSHLLSLAEAVELARTLGRLPRRLVVYAVAGGCFDLGAPVSPEVQLAVDTVAEMVRREIAEARAEESSR
jgi:hydrogenase maturation protease